MLMASPSKRRFIASMKIGESMTEIEKGLGGGKRFDSFKMAILASCSKSFFLRSMKVGNEFKCGGQESFNVG